MNRPFKAVVVVLSAIVAVSLPLLAIAASGRRYEQSPVNKQVLASRTAALATKSKAWEDVPGLDIDVCQKGPVSESISAVVSGAPVRLRIVKHSHGGGGETPLLPGNARFAGGDPTSVEATFAFGGGGGGEDLHGFHVQWRSPSGRKIEMEHALVRLLYKKPAKLCA